MLIAPTIALLVGCGGSSNAGSSPSSTAADSGENNFVNDSFQNSGPTGEIVIPADSQDGRDIDGSTLFNSGINSARLQGAVYGTGTAQADDINGLPIEFSGTGDPVVPTKAFLVKTSDFGGDIYVSVKNTSPQTRCLIALKLASGNANEVTGFLNEFLSAATIGIRANSNPGDVIHSECLVPGESAYIHRQLFSDVEIDAVSRVRIEDLESRPGILVEGLALQPLSYAVDDTGRFIDVTIVNNGTVPLLAQSVLIISLDDSGQPVAMSSASISLDEAREPWMPGEERILNANFGSPRHTQVTTIRAVVTASSRLSDALQLSAPIAPPIAQQAKGD